MPRARRWTDRADAEDGSASIEFLTVGLLLLVPLVYLVLALAAVQAGALGVEGAARQASRVFVQERDAAAADAAAREAISVALADYGVDADTARVRIACAPDPSRCLVRRGFVTVRIAATVPLPLVPPALGAALPLRVPVEATATEQVSRFAGAR
jgi:hypothetical protein